MPALVAGIHVLLSGARRQRKTWMARRLPDRPLGIPPAAIFEATGSGAWSSGHIDAPIRLFDPNADIDDIKPRLPPRFQAFKGEVQRLVLNALRNAKMPVPISHLTSLVAAGRAINTDDKPFMRILTRRVGACLRNLRKKEFVKMTRPPGSLGLWEIAK
jgi:hypothetical protein